MEDKLKKLTNIEHVTVSSTVLANLFGVSTRRIRQFENEGIIKKVARGKYSLQENIKSYITYIQATSNLKNDEKTDEEVNYDVEHALLEKRKREKIELELAEMRGEMHKSEDVERVMNDMLSNFRSKLLALPSRLAPQLVTLTTISDFQDILQREVLDILHELSNYDPEKFYSEEYVGLSETEIQKELNNIDTEEDSQTI